MNNLTSRTLVCLLIGTVTTTVVAMQQAKPKTTRTYASDAAIAAKLVGKWQVEYKDKDGKRLSIGWTVYAKNGMASSRSITKKDGKEINLVLEAKWSVVKGVLTTAITNSSDPKIVKVGSVTKDRLMAIGDRYMKYTDPDGKVIVEYRLPEQKPETTKTTKE